MSNKVRLSQYDLRNKADAVDLLSETDKVGLLEGILNTLCKLSLSAQFSTTISKNLTLDHEHFMCFMRKIRATEMVTCLMLLVPCACVHVCRSVSYTNQTRCRI